MPTGQGRGSCSHLIGRSGIVPGVCCHANQLLFQLVPGATAHAEERPRQAEHHSNKRHGDQDQNQEVAGLKAALRDHGDVVQPGPLKRKKT